MSDIFDEGYGSSHDWNKLGTSQFRVTEYQCRNCHVAFQHDYVGIPDIFEAIEKQDIPDVCHTESEDPK